MESLTSYLPIQSPMRHDEEPDYQPIRSAEEDVPNSGRYFMYRKKLLLIREVGRCSGLNNNELRSSVSLRLSTTVEGSFACLGGEPGHALCILTNLNLLFNMLFC